MNRIKQLRQANGYTQASLGKLINCTGAAVSRYELGQRDLDLATIDQLCSIFKCTADYLLGFSNDPEVQLPRGAELDSRLQKMLEDLDPEDIPIAEAFLSGLKAKRRK